MIYFTEYEKIVYKDGSGTCIKKKVDVNYSCGRQETCNESLVISDSLFVHIITPDGVSGDFITIDFKIRNATEQIYHLGYIGI